MPGLVGYYNASEYRIKDARTGETLYTAGNSPYDSGTYSEAGVGLKTMRRYCIQTGQEMSEEMGVNFEGVKFAELEA